MVVMPEWFYRASRVFPLVFIPRLLTALDPRYEHPRYARAGAGMTAVHPFVMPYPGSGAGMNNVIGIPQYNTFPKNRLPNEAWRLFPLR
jgi:hypothetical protein